jgi:hypothetical protein
MVGQKTHEDAGVDAVFFLMKDGANGQVAFEGF